MKHSTLPPNLTPAEQGYYMPAEWAPHAATWLTWPKDPVTWPDRVPQVERIFAQMIAALTPHEAVRLLVDDAAEEARVRKILQAYPLQWERLHFQQVPTADSWIRDYGPIFLKNKRHDKSLALDWIFNAWGDKYETLKSDDTIPARVLPGLEIPFLEPGIVLEGGSIEVNGQGTLLTTEQCLLNPNRNPQLKQSEVEKYLKSYLGVEQILWLGEGIAGDDTDGHVDDITRFVGERLILTAIEEDPSDENFHPLQENLKRLKSFRDPGGRPFEILTLPMPGPVLSDEGRLPASYANFYIANGVVLVPVFHHPRDAQALAVLQKIFPTRKVIGLDGRDLVWGLGAIHCLSQQQPL